MIDLNTNDLSLLMGCLMATKSHAHPLIKKDVDKLIDKLGTELKTQLKNKKMVEDK